MPSQSLKERAEAVQARGIFLGGPLRKFETVGRNQLSILLRNGLNPDSKVLDSGCGCLRGGYWLIHFLQPGGYYGIEPSQEMLDIGKELIVTPALIEQKQPRFDMNPDLDFQVFDSQFDFIIARSIWTHASPLQIAKMLDEFIATTGPDGVLLTSIKPCPWYRRQYRGDAWVGATVVEPQEGTVLYRFSWIARICQERGLTATRLDTEYGQLWLRITRADAAEA